MRLLAIVIPSRHGEELQAGKGATRSQGKPLAAAEARGRRLPHVLRWVVQEWGRSGEVIEEVLGDLEVLLSSRARGESAELRAVLPRPRPRRMGLVV